MIFKFLIKFHSYSKVVWLKNDLNFISVNKVKLSLVLNILVLKIKLFSILFITDATGIRTECGT